MSVAPRRWRSPSIMNISSPAFGAGQSLPQKFTMYGANTIPPLRISEVSAEACSLALIMDDPDATRGTFTHWLCFNLDPRTTEIKEGETPAAAVQGENDYGQTAYGGPRPPSGTHRYFFRLYALDRVLELPEGVKREALEPLIEAHTIDQATLMGTYGTGQP